MDLGEFDRINDQSVIQPIGGNQLPYAYNQTPNLNSNNLYNKLISDPGTRSINRVTSVLESTHGLLPVQDFEKTYARKLNRNEYTLNPQLGYISLNQYLQADEILAIAFQYTLNGQVYQVGEFATDVPPNPDNPEVLYLKMLKSTSTRPELPIWDLMMKNIYSIGAYQVNQRDFKLNVFYLDPGGGQKRYIPAGKLNGRILIDVLKLDNMNSQRDPIPDGVFDFVPGITILPNSGRIVFPILEPFGDDLRREFGSSEDDQNLADKFVYDVLYDSTKTVARQFPEFNRFTISGSYQSSITSDISLGTFNLPRNSLRVT
ncbi:MAG: cell surface protein SprA, partial [Bacteroidetes bacterium]|nr:cell surface protein SprA [Bacteroidota bacterium]